jgi:transcriptional regulator with XRE-family HTH domain
MGTVIPLRRRPGREPEPLWRQAVGEQLREERRRRNERIADVAGRAGVSPQYLSELERGRKDPSSEVLAAVAGALGLTVLAVAERSARRLGEGLRGPVCLAA